MLFDGCLANPDGTLANSAHFPSSVLVAVVIRCFLQALGIGVIDVSESARDLI